MLNETLMKALGLIKMYQFMKWKWNGHIDNDRLNRILEKEFSYMLVYLFNYNFDWRIKVLTNNYWQINDLDLLGLAK